MAPKTQGEDSSTEWALTAPNNGATDLSGRALAARQNQMVVLPEFTPDGEATGTYRVFTESASEYMVDVVNNACLCADFQYRRSVCKHRRRVAFEIHEGALPEQGEDVSGYYRSHLPVVYDQLKQSLAKSAAAEDPDVSVEAYEGMLEALVDSHTKWRQQTDSVAPLAL